MSVQGSTGLRGEKRRTGLLLAAIALTFFAAIMVKTWLLGR